MESSSLPDHVPELVVEKILGFLPTKLGVQTCFLSKELQGLPSSFLSFDFDEQNHFNYHGSPPPVDQHEHLHEKFMDFLRGYLAYCKKNSGKAPLDKLSIRMRVHSNFEDEYCSINKWLEYACHDRRLKELEVSADFYIDSSSTITEHLIKSQRPLESNFYDKFCDIQLGYTAGNGEFLTSLKLECVKIMELYRMCVVEPPRFSALKILSLKAVRFVNQKAPSSFLRECPSIENLSLEYCSFKKFKNSKLNVSCSSLKYLYVKYCNINDIRVDQALNLESFSFVSLRNWDCGTMILTDSFNLKRINVCVDNTIREFSLSGCHHALEATIKCKEISRFKFFHGYLSAKFSFEIPAPNTCSKRTKTKRKFSFKANRDDHKLPRVAYATILVEELMQEQARLSSSDPTYVAKLASFIQSFSCCKRVNLYGEDFQALAIPKPCRIVTSSPLLPGTSTFKVILPKRLASFKDRDEYDELLETLRWIAPYANVSPLFKDVKEDRHMSSSDHETSWVDFRDIKFI